MSRLYAFLTGARYVSDCHIVIASAGWLWFYVKKLLLNGKMIVHNDLIMEYVSRTMDIEPIVVRDGIAKKISVDVEKRSLLKNDTGLFPKNYVIIPWSFSKDEPLKELVDAARLLPETKFVMTWYFERLSRSLRKKSFIKYLFDGLFAD